MNTRITLFSRHKDTSIEIEKKQLNTRKYQKICAGTTFITLNVLVISADAAVRDCTTVAGVCTLGDYDPTVNNTVLSVTGGATITLSGNNSVIQKGRDGSGDGYGRGSEVAFASPAEGWGAHGLYYVENLNHSVAIGNASTTLGQLYSVKLKTTTDANGNISIESAQKDDWKSVKTEMYFEVGDQQYISTRLGEVTQGQLNVDLTSVTTQKTTNGYDYDAEGKKNNFGTGVINMAAKTSDLFLADGTQSNAAIVWQSKNKVKINAFMNNEANNAKTEGITVQNFLTDTLSYDNVNYAFNQTTDDTVNADNISTLNNLLTKLNADKAAGTLSATDYQQYMNDISSKVLSAESATVAYYQKSVGADNDDITKQRGSVTILKATGEKASVTLASGAYIDHHIEGESAGDVGNGAAIHGENKAKVTIEQGAVLTGDFTGIRLKTGAKGENNGEISGVFNAGPVNGVDASQIQRVGQYLVAMVGDAEFDNNGVMNVSGWGDKNGSAVNYAIGMFDDTTVAGTASRATNSGIINTGDNSGDSSGEVSGVSLNSTKATFTNTLAGNINVGHGRETQKAGSTSATDVNAAEDTLHTLTQYGIKLSAGKAINDGTITLGSKSQNATGMAALSSNGKNAALTNNGTIQLTGSITNTIYKNIGILADKSGDTVISNTGRVISTNANGVTGLFASGDATINHTGIIDLTSGNDNTGMHAKGKAAFTSSGLVSTSGWALMAEGDGNTANTSRYIFTGGEVTGQKGVLHATSNAITTVESEATKLTGIMTTDAGSSSAVTLSKNTLWHMTGDSNVTTLNNTGGSQIVYGASGSVKTLKVEGDYTGNNGTLVMNTVLGDDTSLTDKLEVTGNTAGTTSVTVNNKGGVGALTNNGIELITVGGTSAGTFALANRVAVGAYEYTLNQGTTSATSNNWYLTSVTTSNPDGSYRPEIGTYINNLVMANSLFYLRLHDRVGETQYTDAVTGEQKMTSMWLRQVAGRSEFNSGSGQLKSTNSRVFTQLGGNVAQWSTNQVNRFNLGVMAGYGYSKGTTTSALDVKSRGTTDGYSVGVYGTWYQNNIDKSGWYVDTWVMHNWMKNEVRGDQMQTEKYDSKGLVASVESGYAFHLGDRDVNGKVLSYYVQPKVQITHMGVKADDHTDAQGNVVQSLGSNNIQTRLGVRWYSQHLESIAAKNAADADLFYEINWLHNSKQYGVAYNGTRVMQDSAKNIGEIKIGITKTMSKSWYLWTNIAQQFGQNGFKDTQAVLGVKYSY